MKNYSLFWVYKNHTSQHYSNFNFFGEISDNLQKEIFQKDQIYRLLIEISNMWHDPMHKDFSQKADDLHETGG